MSVATYYHQLSHSGGAERMVCLLATAIAQKSGNCHLITWDDEKCVPFYDIGSNVVYAPLGKTGGFYGKLKKIWRLVRYLRSNSITTLIGFVMSGDKAVYMAAKISGVNLVVAERNAPAIYEIKYGLWQRKMSFNMMRFADRITVQMPAYRDAYPQYLRERIRVIPNPVLVPRNFAEPAKSNNGNYNLLYHGRLDLFQKQLDILLKAFALVSKEFSNWNLVIMGDGEGRDDLNLLSSQLGITEQFQLMPARESTLEVISKAHLYVMPSRWEGFPNSLAEAMAMGLPAVGYRNCSGVADLIEEGRSGWLADGNGNIKSLANELSAAMRNGDERQNRGLAARDAMRKYKPSEQLKKWEEVLDEIECESSK